MIAPTPFFSDRGTHIRILEEARALAARGHQITIATYHIGGSVPSEQMHNIEVRRINRLLFWYTKIEAGPDWQKLILDVMLLRKVWSLTRTERPAILHAHLHEGVLIGWLVQKLFWWRNIKLVSDFHGSLTAEMVSHSYLRWTSLQKIFGWLEQRIDRLGDVAIASSWEFSQRLSAIRNQPVPTIADGVSVELYQQLPTRAQCRTELGLPQNRTIITYAGAFIDNKGLRYLLPAIARVAALRPELLFVLAGYPKESVEDFVNDHDLQSSVHIISPLSYLQMPRVLAASDIALDPKDSSVQQASGKILQYMAAGLPVVCFDRVNNREYLGDGGVYCETVTSKSLANGIIQCVDELPAMRAAGQTNRDRVAQFSWTIAGQQLDEIYHTLLPDYV